jgi:hypothetical protein
VIARLVSATVLSLTAAAACGGGEVIGVAERPATRPAVLVTCATIERPNALSSFTLEDRSLPSIGPGQLGRYWRYRRDGATVEIGVGYDLAEPLEDLDFEGSQRTVGGREVGFSRSGVHRDLFLVRWTARRAELLGDPSADSSADVPACAEVTLATRGLSEREALRIVISAGLSERSTL